MTSSFRNLTINDTGYLQVPSGTSAQRPSLFSNSAIQWTNTGSQSYTVLAGSGTATNTSWTCPANVTSIELLVVAGGGGGGGYRGGGGGGAGGLIYNPAFTVVPGTTYTVTVGTGGAGGAGDSISRGSNGGNSIFGSITALGGGGGGTTGFAGGTGGSGGGGRHNDDVYGPGLGTAGQGNSGAWGGGSSNNGGGGGGAGGPGIAGHYTSANPGGGGVGLAYAISGTTTYYAGGGGGGGNEGGANAPGGLGGGGSGSSGASAVTGSPGTASTGGGGGGGNIASAAGGAGGSGTVIIRYTLADSSTQPYGQTRYNTSTNQLESYGHNNAWNNRLLVNEKIVTSGLIMNLDASTYLAAMGTTWYDVSGYGNNGTLTNGPAYTYNFGGGFVLDGTDDWIALPNGLLQGTGDFTASVWIKPIGGTSNTLICSYPSSNMQMFYNTGTTGLWMNNATAYYSNQGNDFQSSTPILITALRRGTALEIYVNGVLKKVGSSSDTVGTSGTLWRFGANTSGGERYSGTVYVMHVYNRALSQAEITQNFQAQAPRFNKGIRAHLAGWRYVGSGVMANNNLVWYSEQGTRTGYSATIWNEAFEGDFTLICSWRRDYIGMGILYGRSISCETFTGYSSDATGPYAGAMTTSGFQNGQIGTWYGQYHAPITGSGGSSQNTLYYFKWQRQGNTVTMQYSSTSPNGPWSDNNSANRVIVNSYDKVICNIGEASGTEYSPLTFISLTY